MPGRRSRMVSFRAEAGLVRRFHDRVRSGARSAYLEMLLRWAMSFEEADDGGRREHFDTHRAGFAEGFAAAAKAALDGTLRPENLEAMRQTYLRGATENVATRPSHRLRGGAVERTRAAHRTSVPQSESADAPASKGDEVDRRVEQLPSTARKASEVEIGKHPREPGATRD